MAVVQMQKVRAIVHQPEVDGFLSVLQRHGVMEFTAVDAEALAGLSGAAPHAALLPRVQHALGFLKTYEVKRGLWRTLRDGSVTTYTETEIAKQLEETEVVSDITRDVEAIQVELAEKNAAVQHLEQQRELLKTWSPVTNKLSELDTPQTVSVLVSKPNEIREAVLDVLTQKLAELSGSFATESYGANVLLTVWRAELETVETLVGEAGLLLVTRPEGLEEASIELTAVEERLAAARGEQGQVHDQAAHTAHTHLHQLRIAGEILEWEQGRYSVLSNGKQTASTAVLDGWLMADMRDAIEADLKNHNVTALFTEIEPAADEVPPVEIKNNSFLRPFEVVTRLYGMPGHKDLDPTLFLAGFFFLFFGLSLTDVGYGITLMVVASIVLTLFKVSDAVRTFMKLLLFMGLGSALLGMLFGGYLGIPAEALPSWLQAIQIFDPIGNPLPVFYLALSLGVFQVMVGMLIKIYSDYKNNDLVGGLLDQTPWLFLFILGILFVGIVTGYVTFITTDTIVKLVYLGFALVAITAARKGEGLTGKLIAVLAALYNDTIGYFSDILSYSRLLALGLATSALAFAVNLIAEIVSGTPVVGPILAVAILIIGHVFALVINTLGAFIHSARLQFVEFFGKFISGTGRNFSPLSRSKRHITAKVE
ncbi:MAG: V/A-type H+-transporting ATPase subunit I [Candidatus Paceibacteria bacterium]|jgi:V/A-type H+-transporting ATPase subunit I